MAETRSSGGSLALRLAIDASTTLKSRDRRLADQFGSPALMNVKRRISDKGRVLIKLSVF
jgi:hypothetical protein